MPDVAITKNDEIGRAIEDALGAIEVEPLVREKLVAIKPNDTWASAEDTTGVTQGDTLRAVIRYLKRFQPRHLVVSGGAGAAETDEVFSHSGMMAALEDEQVEFFDHNKPPVREIELPYAPQRDVAGPQRTVMVNPRVLQYETVVSLAQLKLHSIATVTLGLKNIAMSYPAADHYGHPRQNEDRAHDFFDDMHSFIAAMAKRFPVSLSVIVGHPAMVATGPLGGHAVETGMVIASTDPLAADVVGARLLGFEAQAVRHLWEAARLGVGEASIAQMGFPRMSVREAIEAFTEAVYGTRLTFEHA